MRSVAAILFILLLPFAVAAERPDFPSDRALIEAMNDVRRNPRAYSQRLELLREKYDGRRRVTGPNQVLLTQEGVKAVEDAIKDLRETPPCRPLRLEPLLSKSALDHVRDQGPTGRMGHEGSRGETLKTRVQRYGLKYRAIGENISYGPDSAEDVIMQLIIDDGVPSRGHRKNILHPRFNAAGAACGPHQRFDNFCVIDFAEK
jgi:uncharacterized protein YkwD